ncbi:hypothetical protein [Brevibacterium casei]
MSGSAAPSDDDPRTPTSASSGARSDLPSRARPGRNRLGGGPAIAVLGVAALSIGVLLPNPFLFVPGSLAVGLGTGLVVYAITGRRAASAGTVFVLAVVLLAAPAVGKSTVTGSSVAWTAAVAGDDFTVVDGRIFTFAYSAREGRTQRSVRLLDPDDGSVVRSWSAEALQRPSITGDGGVVFTSAAVSTQASATTITMFDAAGRRLWATPVSVEVDADIVVTAAAGGAANVVTCPRTQSGSDRQGCRLLTIDATGAVVDDRGVGFEWDRRDGTSWSDLPGRALPQATLVTDGRTGIDMYSPAAVGPLTTIPFAETVEDFGSRFAGDALITAERRGDQGCRVVARSVVTGAQVWSADVACTPMTDMRLWATTDDGGPLYLRLDELDERTVSVLALDPSTGELTRIAEAAYRSRGPHPPGTDDLVREATAGRFVVTATGGRLTSTAVWGAGAARGGGSVGGSTVTVTVPGIVDLPAVAGGDVLAVISDTSGGRQPWLTAHNPYLFSRWFDSLGEDAGSTSSESRPPGPQYLTVIDATTGKERSSTLFTSPITYFTVLPGGQTFAATEDGKIRVVS